MFWKAHLGTALSILNERSIDVEYLNSIPPPLGILQLERRRKQMETKNKPLCVAVSSGGMDSTTTVLWQLQQGYRVILLHFNYGQLAELAEEERIERIAHLLNLEHIIWDIRDLGKLGKSPLTDPTLKLPEGFASVMGLGCWVPSRNVVFLSIASAIAESMGGGVITLGGESSESFYKDNTAEFADLFTRMLELGSLKPVRVEFPLANWTKIDEIQWGYKNGYEEVYSLTWSCDRSLKNERGEFAPCGRCGCCNSRRFAYYRLGFRDPQVYLDDGYFFDIFLPEYERRKGEVSFKYE